MSDSFHGERRTPAEQELAKPYPFGERVEHVHAWMSQQADAARQISYTTHNDDATARWYHGYAHGLAVAAQHLQHLIDNNHQGDKQ